MYKILKASLKKYENIMILKYVNMFCTNANFSVFLYFSLANNKGFYISSLPQFGEKDNWFFKWEKIERKSQIVVAVVATCFCSQFLLNSMTI